MVLRVVGDALNDSQYVEEFRQFHFLGHTEEALGHAEHLRWLGCNLGGERAGPPDKMLRLHHFEEQAEAKGFVCV